jgi:hypothetical protein
MKRKWLKAIAWRSVGMTECREAEERKGEKQKNVRVRERLKVRTLER